MQYFYAHSKNMYDLLFCVFACDDDFLSEEGEELCRYLLKRVISMRREIVFLFVSMLQSKNELYLFLNEVTRLV